jgi:hypothetical protein
MNWTHFFARSRSFVALVAAVTTLTYACPPNAAAMVAPTDVVTTQDPAQRQQDLKKIQTLLESKVVRHRLVMMGLNDSEIESRLNQMSDQELHQVASRIDKVHPAGDGAGLIITVLLVGILVLLFIYLAKRV